MSSRAGVGAHMSMDGWWIVQTIVLHRQHRQCSAAPRSSSSSSSSSSSTQIWSGCASMKQISASTHLPVLTMERTVRMTMAAARASSPAASTCISKLPCLTRTCFWQA